MEKLQVHLNSDEIEEFCAILLKASLAASDTPCYLDTIREALDRGETVSIQRNDNHD